MKIKKLITSLACLLTVTTLIVPLHTSAQEEIPRPTKPEKACENMKPDFDFMYSELEIIKALQGDEEASRRSYNLEAYESAFKDARDAYHLYTECVFNYAEAKILGSVGASKGTVMANTPNFEEDEIPIIGPGIGWLTAAACLKHTDLDEIIEDTNADSMLPPLLENYNAYADHLDKLVQLYSFIGNISEELTELSQLKTLEIKEQIITSAKRRSETEKENALVAMNITFTSLKELRMAFVMHVHFQCILNSLDKYRKALEDVRTIVDSLPFELQDASITCP